jgi:Flp pilus assembly pilin Flp
MKPSSTTHSSGRPSRKREAGQTAAEYAVVLSVITIGVAVSIAILSGGIATAVERVASLIPY